MWPFRKNTPDSPNHVEPPVDLDKPVENPALTAALIAHANDGSDDTAQRLFVELNLANYLVAVLADHSDISWGQQDGQSVIKKDSQLAILCCSDAAGQNLVPLFTDWDQIHAWTDDKVSTLVMPASQAWEFVTVQPQYDGVVINPAGNSLELHRDQLAAFQTAQATTSASEEASPTEGVVIENEELSALLDQVQDDPSVRSQIYHQLTRCNLLLGTREPLTDGPAQRVELQEDTPITFLTTQSPDGQPALPVFTDAAALRARNAEAYPLGMSASRIVELVLEEGYDGIVLNPASNWIYISRKDLESISA